MADWRGMDAVVKLSVEKTELNREASELQPAAVPARRSAPHKRATGNPAFGDTLLRMTRPTYDTT